MTPRKENTTSKPSVKSNNDQKYNKNHSDDNSDYKSEYMKIEAEREREQQILMDILDRMPIRDWR